MSMGNSATRKPLIDLARLSKCRQIMRMTRQYNDNTECQDGLVPKKGLIPFTTMSDLLIVESIKLGLTHTALILQLFL